MLRKAFIIFIFSCFASYSNAQITDVCARILVGIESDSITWAPNTCTSFGGYVVLGSTSPSSGFVPLDTVFQEAYEHENVGEITWYYQIGMLCNGVLTSLSTVVSNARPITPDILDIDIVNGVPVLSWNASPTPEVIGYQIYKETPYGSGNYFPYPSSGVLVNGLSFTDVNASELLVRYAIAPITPCNKGLIGIGNSIDGTTGPHTSMIADLNMDTCERRYNFSWNAYENWALGVDQYEIWLNRNGLGYQQIATTNSLNYTYENVQDGDLLVFQIRAKENGNNTSALSNEINLVASVHEPIDYIELNTVTYNFANTVDIDWQWDMVADFASGNLEYSDNGIDWQNLSSLSGLGNNPNTYNYASNDLIARYYRVRGTDICGFETVSNHASTFILSGKKLEGQYTNVLVWEEANVQYLDIDNYELYRIVNGSSELVYTTTGAALNYYDELDVTREALADLCYYVVVNGVLNLPDGDTRAWSSQSNLFCIDQDAALIFPNAFVPEGSNRVFRPVAVFGQSISNYSLLVYDRYGALLFESNDWQIGWEGFHAKTGEELPQGTYTYVARWTKADGMIDESFGTVTLLR